MGRFSFLLLCKSLYRRRGGNDVCVYASFTEGSAPGNTAGHTRTYVVLVSAVAQCPRSLRSRLRSRITECFSFLLIRPWARDCLLIRSRNSWNSTFIPRAAIPHPVTDLGQPAFLTRTSSAYCRSCNEFLPVPLTFLQTNESPNAKRCTRCEAVISTYLTSIEDITCFVSHISYNHRSSLPCFGRKKNLCLNNRAILHLNFTPTKYPECFLDVTDKNVLLIVFIKIKLILFTKIIERRLLCYKCVTEFIVKSFYYIIELQYKVIKM